MKYVKFFEELIADFDAKVKRMRYVGSKHPTRYGEIGTVVSQLDLRVGKGYIFQFDDYFTLLCDETQLEEIEEIDEIDDEIDIEF